MTPNNSHILIAYLLRWLIDWASLIDALAGILSLGFITLRLGLRMAKAYTIYRYNHNV